MQINKDAIYFHQELCAAFRAKEEIYKNLINKGQQNRDQAGDSNVETGINNLKERWESVDIKLTERKVPNYAFYNVKH